MALKLTLKPNERIVVNGCQMRNSDRRHVLVIETHADVIRGQDLLDQDDVASPVAQVYFLIQTALLRPDLRDRIVPLIQAKLAELATVFTAPLRAEVFNAANHVSLSDYYKALRALRPLMRREAELLNLPRQAAVPREAERAL